MRCVFVLPERWELGDQGVEFEELRGVVPRRIGGERLVEFLFPNLDELADVLVFELHEREDSGPWNGELGGRECRC